MKNLTIDNNCFYSKAKADLEFYRLQNVPIEFEEYVTI